MIRRPTQSNDTHTKGTQTISTKPADYTAKYPHKYTNELNTSNIYVGNHCN